MSFLDLYQGDQDQALRSQPNEGGDLPATFGESFQAAWDYGRLFEQSIAGTTARQEALQDYIDDVQQRTGKDPAAGLDYSAMNMGVDGGAFPADMLDQVNAGVDKINASRSPDQAVPTLGEGDLEQRAVDKSRAAGRALAAVAGREHSGLGLLAGGIASAATDPINLMALPVAPEMEGIGILASALKWGGVAAASQAAIEGVGAPYREQVQPGYLESGAPVENVLEAGAGGAALGGLTRFLGNAWTRFKTGSWPTSVRDAGNVVESEANIAGSNVYAGAEGEVAHREALTASIDQILREQPVDVKNIVTPEIGAAQTVEPARQEAAVAADVAAQERQSTGMLPEPELPFEATAAEGQARQSADALTEGVRQIAARAGYDMPQDEAGQVAAKLMRMSPEDAQDALRTLQTSPQQAAEGIDRPGGFPSSERPAVPDAQGLGSTVEAPDFGKALQGDIDRERATSDLKIPVDVDENGEPIHRSVDDLMGEADAMQKASEQIAACAAPAGEEAA